MGSVGVGLADVLQAELHGGDVLPNKDGGGGARVQWKDDEGGVSRDVGRRTGVAAFTTEIPTFVK
jgi:hypothetical protein